jgi:DNA-binding MarR family transcriptional regulator
MREISQVLHVSPRTITDMIDSLEGRGLVARCAHATDRRVTLLRLTEAGARELAAASTGAERVAAAAISALDADEQQTLQSLLERVCVPAGKPVR